MKKRISALLLTVAMLLATTPVTVAAAYGGDGITVTVTETNIKADRVFNSEGYGSLTIDANYDSPYGFLPPQYALIDGNGNFVFSYGRFPCGFNLYDGVFVNGIVTNSSEYGSSGNYSLFDLSGKQVIPGTYDYLSYYNGYGQATTRTYTDPDDAWIHQDKHTLIDRQGKTVLTLPALFSVETSFSGGEYEFEYKSWGVGYAGNAGGHSDGLLWFYSVNPVKNNISELTIADYEGAEAAAITDGRTCGYMDLKGNVVIPQQFSTVYPFSEGLAAVAGGEMTGEFDFGCSNLQGEYGYIDKTGKTVIDFQYSAASSFAGGYAYVANDGGKYGYIDKTGKLVVPMVYDAAFGAGDGLFSVGNIVGQTTNSWDQEIDILKYGFTDAAGKVIVPLEYDDVSRFDNGVAYALKDGTISILKVQTTDAPSAWAVEQVSAAISAGLVPENLQKNYTKPVSRGDVAQMFINLIEKSSGQTIDAFMAAKGVSVNESAFTDTSDKAVLAANALGIINGVGDGKFDPNGTLTRGQIAAIINRTARVLDVNTEGYTHSFTDVAGHWANAELGWPVAAGVITGIGNNKFDPDGKLTVEQAIAIAYRALQAPSTPPTASE